MRIRRKRLGAITAVVALLGSLVATVAIGVSPASAGTVTTTNACFSNATATYSDLNWGLTGVATPNPATLGAGNITLGSSSVAVNIPATLLLAGYNLGLLTVGVNNIPTNVYVARHATNVSSPAGGNQVDNFSIVATTTITDPNGIPGSGDESATPLSVNQPLPNMVVTPSGGNVAFAQAAPGAIVSVPLGTGGAPVAVAGSLFAQAVVGGGLIKANFDCSPGTTIISPPGGTSGTTFTPSTPAAFDTVVVTAPPTAPVCTGEDISVGANQTQTIDFTNNCTDVNGNATIVYDSIGFGFGNPAAPTTCAPTPTSPVITCVIGTGTLNRVSAGVYTYTNTNPAATADLFGFTVGDATGLRSNTALVNISILGNQCDATTALCSLTQVIDVTVTGTTMTMNQAAQFVTLAGVTLNGEYKLTNGAIQAITVTNARGSAAGWSVTGQVTDFKTATAPAASCSGGDVNENRLCIPANNLAWGPSAGIFHTVIPGDVAKVDAGATGDLARPWTTPMNTTGTLCISPVNQGGGTFRCNANLSLGVPASAGAGQYKANLTLTLA